MINDFASNRTNLTILQFIIYGIISYVFYALFGWGKLSIILILVYVLQFITRVKGVADGMVIRQIMLDNKLKANEVIEKIKKEAENARKNNNIN